MDDNNKKTGILRVDVAAAKSRRASLELKLLTQGEPTSPQPSIDRLSVTFAEDSLKSDTPPKCNLYVNPVAAKMDKVHFPHSTDGEESDVEDYSASVNAIMQRRASTRRSSRRRRTSSPFNPDVLPSANEAGGRRRSSVFTTSSGDTAITMDENIANEVTQEEIFENIKLHKEVLRDVKMQPWPMRKKLKLVVQAKNYIKKHEGALQERLAQSHSTKDMLARWNIYLIRKWQRYRREIANLSNWFIPWERKIKEIESHFGSVVASYFIFLRWLFWVNIVLAVVLISFVALPELLTYVPKTASDERKFILPEDKYNSTNFLTLWDFEGVFKYSPLFYGWYTNWDSNVKGYRLPFAYFITCLVAYAYSFFATLRKMAENSRMSKLSEKDDECVFSWKLFTAWDYMIGNAETAHNRVASIVMGFKEALLEEAEKKRPSRNWKVICARTFVNTLVLGLLSTSAYAVVMVVKRSTEQEATSTVWRRNEITVVITAITLVFPMFFEILGFIEQYHPRKQLRLQLARIMVLNLLNLYSLIFALFDKIGDMTDEYKNITDALTELQLSSNTSLQPYDCSMICTSSEIDTTAAAASLMLAAVGSTTTIRKIFTENLLPTGTTSRALEIDYPTDDFMFLRNYTPEDYPTASSEYYKDNGTDETTPQTFEFSNSTDVYCIDGDCITDGFSANYSDYENGTTPESTFQTSEEYNPTDFFIPSGNYETDDFPTFSSFENDSSTENPFGFPESNTVDDLFGLDLDFEDNGTIAFDTSDVTEETTTSYDLISTYSDKEITTKLSTTDFDERSSTELSISTYKEHTTQAGNEVTTELNNEITPTFHNTNRSKYCRCNNFTDISNIPTEPLNYSTRSRLRTLCWETMFGQEMLKLTVMDLVMTVLSTLALDFFRGIFVRVMNRCWCWDLEKRFPQYGDFKVAENILHLVNNQGMVWMGMFFSPGLVVLNVFKLYVMMYLRAWAVLTCNVPPEVIFRASRSNNFYYALLLMMLFLCVLPVGYAIVRIKPSGHCGPFSQYANIYHIFTETIKSGSPELLQTVLDYIASPGIVIPLLVLLILIIYYLISLTGALREANTDLKVQLRRERTEERRKMFQFADRRRRGGSSGSGELANTPFAKWKTLLNRMPTGKSLDETPKQEDNECNEEGAKTVNKSKDFFSKLMRKALGRSSTTDEDPNQNFDDATDTEQHDSLPEDISDVKPQVHRPIKRLSSSNFDFQKAVTDLLTQKRELKQSGDQTIARQGSSTSRSESIPVIKISKTESSECIVKELKKSDEEKKQERFKPKIRCTLKKQSTEIDEEVICHFGKEVENPLKPGLVVEDITSSSDDTGKESSIGSILRSPTQDDSPSA